MTAARASSSSGLHRFRSLDYTVRRRLDGLLQGDHRGVGLGPGNESEELAVYQPGHDSRRIDWRVTARMAELHLWLTAAERELDTWVLIDRTASMAFGTAEQEKSELATVVSGAFGLLTEGPGNRLGWCELTPDGLHWSRPASSRIAAHHCLRASQDARDGSTATGLGEGIEALARRHRRQGLRIIVSDLLSPDGEFRRPFDWEQPLRSLANRHDVVMVEVIDHRDTTLPDVGMVVLTDPESGRQREVQTHDPRVRARFAQAAAEHRSATRSAVKAAGAGHLVLRTDRDWAADLAHFIRSRRRLPARRQTRRISR